MAEINPITKKIIQLSQILVFVFFLLFLIIYYFSRINPELNQFFNFGNDLNSELNLTIKIILIFGLMLLYILILGLSIKNVPPISHTKFWAWRSLGDLILIDFVLVTIISFIFELIRKDSIALFSSRDLTAIAFYLSAVVASSATLSLILARYYFGGFPSKFRINFNFRLKKGDFKIILNSFVLILFFSYLIAVMYQIFNVEPKEQFSFVGDYKNQWWLLVIPGAIIAPVVEEIFFRGYMQKMFMGDNYKQAIIITGAIFAIFHFDIYSFPVLFIVGVVLGNSYYKTNNIIVSILIHMLNNLVAFIPFLWA